MTGKQFDFRANHAGLDLVDVEQRVEHAGHRAQRLADPRDHLALPLAFDRARQQPLKQRQRLQRLAQVVAGGGEKARLGRVGRFRLPPGGLERVVDALALGDVGEGDDHAFDAAVLRAVRQDPAQAPGAAARLDLALDRQMLRQHGARVGQQRVVGRKRGQVRQRAPDIAGNEVEHATWPPA